MTDKSFEIESLKREIGQLKQDKEFVWNLWKKLQLSSPDLTSAMNLVVQREKSKTEKDHRELLNDVEEKNIKLIDIKRELQTKEGEIKELRLSKMEAEDRVRQLERRCGDVADKAELLSGQLEARGEQEGDNRQLVERYEVERKRLLGSVSQLQSCVASLSAERAQARVEAAQKGAEAERCWRHTAQELRQRLDQAEARGEQLQAELDVGRGRDSASTTIITCSREDPDDGSSSTRGPPTSETPSVDVEPAGPFKTNEEPVFNGVVSPVIDLNYKVDRLSLHMRHLEQCLSQRPTALRNNSSLLRARSNPSRVSGKADTRKEELMRKVQFLTQKFAKVEKELFEERKSGATASECLTKANSRLKTLQLSVKQLRKQSEDSKETQQQLKNINTQVEEQFSKARLKIESQKKEIECYVRNSVQDADRIQDLLETLETARTEITNKKIQTESERSSEMDRLHDLIRDLESDKGRLETDLKTIQAKAGELERNILVSASQRSREVQGNKNAEKLKPKNRRSKGRHKPQHKETKNMKKILTHFAGIEEGQGDEEEGTQSSTNDRESVVVESNDDEWVEIDEDEAGESTTISEVSESDRKLTERSTNSSSIGQRVVRVAGVNRICSRTQSTAAVDTVPSVCHQCHQLRHRAFAQHRQMRALAGERQHLKNQARVASNKAAKSASDLAGAKARCRRMVDTIKAQAERLELLITERRQLLQAAGISYEGYRDSDIDNSAWMDHGSLHWQELSKEAGAATEAKHELLASQAEIVRLREKIVRLEKELTCKKRLVEDQRSRLAILDSVRDKETADVQQKERRLREAEEISSRLKTQLESVQTRFSVILAERRSTESRIAGLEEKQRSGEQRETELRQAKRLLELQLSRIDRESERRLDGVVEQSGATLDKAASQIHLLKGLCGKYEHLILGLARTVSEKTREIRRLVCAGRSVQSAPARKESTVPVVVGDPALQLARDRAAGILELSQDELDCLLAGKRCDHNARKQTNNNSTNSVRCQSPETPSSDLVQACRRALKKESFDRDLPPLFSEKLDEIAEVISPSICSDSGCASN